VRQPNAEVGIISIGGTKAAVREAVDRLRADGIIADTMRIRGFPFGKAIKAFIDSHETIFVVEQNRDAQLRSMLAIELGVPRDDMHSILDYGGLPLTAKAVVDAVSHHLAGVTV
jgi:2-oxoglutarate ferredoxin oxidoreductase subunit alpha